MKKQKKLGIKKVTLRNLDEPTLDAIAGGYTGGNTTCLQTRVLCQTITCPIVHTCVNC